MEKTSTDDMEMDNSVGPIPCTQHINAKNVEENPTCCRKFTLVINGTLEKAFGRLGFIVATHPWKTILISLVVFAACMAGIIEYTNENRGEKLWVSQTSDSLKHKSWVEKTFPVSFRQSNVLLEKDGNLLTTQGLIDLYKIQERVKSVGHGTPGLQWRDICYRVGNLSCIPSSILELWSHNLTLINSTTNAQIIQRINENNVKSPLSGRRLNIRLLLGGLVETNSLGHVIKASVAKIVFKLQKNSTFDDNAGLWVDKNAERWEEGLDEELESGMEGYTVYSYSKWAHNKAARTASDNDLQFFVFGYILVIIYLSSMLGGFDRLNHKVYLAMVGISIIGMSVGIAYSLGSAIQLKITAVHNVLPFLLLGIGVDDVFVIVQSWDNVGGAVKNGRSIPEKMQEALSHAGVSILVTSVTDVCAFLIGASTILPALKSFSIFAAIGIISVFLLTITFFVAWLALDGKRQGARRDALLCCLKVNEQWKPLSCSEKSHLSNFIDKVYAPVILSVPGKIVIVLAACGLLAGGSYGLSQLEQNFDPIWFLNPTSTPRMYQDNVKKFFPSDGIHSAAYTGEMDYFNESLAMDNIVSQLNADQYVSPNSVHSWYHSYKAWLNATQYKNELVAISQNEWRLPNATRFNELLKAFLSSELGRSFSHNIAFDGSGKIQGSSITFKHTLFSSSSNEIEGMESVQSDIKAGSIQSERNPMLPFVYAPFYISWETNKVIASELFRNVLLAALCVFIVTLFLLSNLWASLVVVVCVSLSLIDIAGYMHFWNLSIDVITTIIMVIAIGLTVDYAAHIAHGFMVANRGSKKERMHETLVKIAPAVIHGGMSTFLAFALLSTSESYGFFTFFKVFFLVVVFGMFHGLVLLPVVMSMIGPQPYFTPPVEVVKGIQPMEIKDNVELKSVTNTDPVYIVTVEGSLQNQGFVE